MKELLSPAVLEQELARQLSAASSARPRAMSATIVVAGTGEEGPAPALLLAGRRPVRLVHALPFETEEGMEASTRCAIDRQSRGVCIEDIVLRTRGGEAIEGALWGPFVIRDLPAILYWRRPLEELAACADDCAHRIDLALVDGEKAFAALTSKRKPGGIHTLAGLLRDIDEGGLAIADLAWERLFDLRRHTARLVAAREEQGRESPGTREIISLDCHIPQPWSRVLFAAWLEERTEKAGVKCVLSDAPGLPVFSVRLHPELEYRDAYTGAASSESAPVKDSAEAVSVEAASTEAASAEAAVFTRLVDRPHGDRLWRAALDTLLQTATGQADSDATSLGE